jgi:hypothetical protein
MRTHFGTGADAGTAAMYCDRERVGALAVTPEEFRAGDSRALFKILVATTMFQRRQDRQIFRVLRELPRKAAREIGSARSLLRLVDASPCPYLKSAELLRNSCDLAKDPVTREGTCTANATVPCHLKRHTVHLRRYGHFGKVPTSAALVLREAGAADLNALRAEVLERERDETVRADALKESLKRAWRVNEKIASMFLSAISNPDLSPLGAPWAEGLDWTRYVVIDSNVDLFLSAIRYRGGTGYEERRAFIHALARHIDLSALDGRVHSYNPRLVQQALYLFMSGANRKTLARDCTHLGARACFVCPADLSRICPVRCARS